MKIKIFTNETFEDEQAVLDIDSGKVIMKGDSYHDKIEEKIEGMIETLNFLGVDYEILEGETINPTSEMFKKLDFARCL